MNINYAPGANLLRGMREQDDFDYNIRELPIVTGPDIIEQTLQDCVVDHITEQTATENNFAIDVYDSTLIPGHSFVNNTPSIVTCDAAGVVTRLVDGLASIDIVTPVGRRNYSRQMSAAAYTAGDWWQSFVPGSLGAHIVNNMLGLVAGKTRSIQTTDVFTSNNYDTANPAAVRNPNLFAAGVDMSPITIVNKTYIGGPSTYTHPGLLISPRHIIGAAHFRAVGPMVWLDNQGVYHTASVLSWESIPNTDIVIQYLDTSITGITPFKVLPADLESYMPNSDFTVQHNLPCLTKIKHTPWGDRDTLQINHFHALDYSQLYYYDSIWIAAARTDTNIAALATEAWQGAISGGDSGGPLFIPINGESVIVGTYHTATTSHAFHTRIAAIEAVMNSLAVAQGDMTAYSLNKVNLTSFTSYA